MNKNTKEELLELIQDREESHKFICYAAFRDTEVVYIGEGRIGREYHITSGVSHLYEANKSHFSGERIDVIVLRYFDTKEEALEFEIELIKKYNPLWNVKDKVIDKMSEDHLNKMKGTRINSVTEVLRGSRASLTESIRDYLEDVENDYNLIVWDAELPSASIVSEIVSMTEKPKYLVTQYNKISRNLYPFVLKNDITVLEDLDSVEISGEDSFVFLNQSSNRGTSIVDFKGKVLIIHTGTPNSNKVQMAGRWRDVEATVDVVYLNVEQDEVGQPLVDYYAVYCSDFRKKLSSNSPKAIKQNKKDLVLKYYNPNLSYRENADILLQQHGLKVSYVSIRKYVSEA